MTDTMPGRRVEYLPLDELVPNPVNPKRHDVEGIDGSLDTFGVIDLIVRDDRTGQLISGHGRTETLSVKRDRLGNAVMPPMYKAVGDSLVAFLTGPSAATAD